METIYDDSIHNLSDLLQPVQGAQNQQQDVLAQTTLMSTLPTDPVSHEERHPPNIINVVPPSEAASVHQPQAYAPRSRHQNSFLSNASVSMQEKDMYQIQANHFLSNHFGSLAANPRNLEKLITHRKWL